MGAGVAASPHCPTAVRPGLGGEAARDGRFRDRIGAGGSSVISGVRPVPEGAFRFPRWLPVRAEALAVRRSAVRNRSPSSCPSSRKAEASDPFGRSQSPKLLVPPDRPWIEILGPAGFAAPESEDPVLPDASGAEAPFSPVAARRPKSRFPPGWSWTRRSGVRPGSGSFRARRLVRFRVGAVRCLPLSHPLKDKPAASAWRRLRQPPCLSRRRLFVWWDKEVRLAQAVAGRLSSVAGRSSRPRTKAVMKTESHQADSGRFRLWITRITGITETVLKYSPERGLPARIGPATANRERTARLAARACAA